MKKVAVLLSAYNGYEFIEEQIKSIYEQTYVNMSLYIRDDGSDTSFKEMLKELQQYYGFNYYDGDNIGFCQSFLQLLQNVDDADYYAFADQDDIWYSDKIAKAVKWLDLQEKEKKGIPLLYHGAYDIINSNNEKIGTFYYPDEGYDFARSITENHYSGFAMVFNRAMRECILKGKDSYLDYHDWWATMIGRSFGKAYSDSNSCAAHRAHEKNATKITFGNKIKWLRRILTEKSDISMRTQLFAKEFYDRLSNKDRVIIDMFVCEKYYIKNALKKCCYPRRWRPNWSSEIVMRFLMLIGRI